MLATLPTANFSANDFIVEFTNCYDKYQGATFIRLTDTTGTLTYTGTAADTGVVTDTVIRMSYLVGSNIIEFALKATATPVGNNGTIPVTINVIGTIVPTTRTVSWYKVSGATARSQTLFLQNTGLGVAVQITIRPKSTGVATVTFGEQIRGLLPPFNRLSTELRNTITYIYNGAQYNLIVYRGQKYLSPNPTLTQSAISILTPTNQYYSAFEEQLNVTLRVFNANNTIQTQALSNFDLGFNASNSFGGNMQFFLYSRAVCNRASIYLSGRYGMLDRIDVSTVVLAFIDGYGLHQYARFNGNNVGRFNVEAGTLKKDVTSLVAPANNGEIYEAIDLTLESDAGSSAAAYKVTADEVERVIGGLMAAPFIWLVTVIYDEEFLIPVRVERSSVKFIGSLQDSQPKATLTIILNQPLGIAQP